MRVTVLLFATAREAAGRACDVEVREGATAAEVLAALSTRPELAALAARSRLAVNHAFAPPETVVHAGDEVALVPPVGGG